MDVPYFYGMSRVMHEIDIARFLKKCTICPRECGVDRTRGKKGFCRASGKVEVHSARLHFGEEPAISGADGSGTIFLNHCNMRCVYCQNYRFSQVKGGKEFEIDGLADLMIFLQGKKAYNINFVTPTHYAVHVANAVIRARKKGLEIPIVYNSSGYEKVETIRMLNGVIDIYLADMRYGDNQGARRYSNCDDYVEINRIAIMEMYRQVGNLQLAKTGIAARGIIIRHLILPDNESNPDKVFSFISKSLGRETYISLMSQYYPTYMAFKYNKLSRGINKNEYDRAVALLDKYDLKNGWIQEYTKGKIDLDFAGTNIEPDV
jgi:putative pyruvate formate lyase activating enzyme